MGAAGCWLARLRAATGRPEARTLRVWGGQGGEATGVCHKRHWAGGKLRWIPLRRQHAGGEQTVLLLGAASCSQGNVSDQKPGLLNSRVHKAGPSGPGTGLRSPRLQVPASLCLPHSAGLGVILGLGTPDRMSPPPTQGNRKSRTGSPKQCWGLKLQRRGLPRLSQGWGLPW